TVDVFHGLIARVGNLGVRTLEELSSYTSRVTDAQRRKSHLAAGLPSAPGVYLFKDPHGRVLYVGTSRDIRRRVRSYFTASEQRTRMAQMVMLASEVTPIVCATPLEAAVRELRLIAQHGPAFNRRSRHPTRRPWVKLTREAFPRLSIVREVRDDGATYAGPFASMQAAQEAVAAIHEVLPLRQCTTRLSATVASSSCMLADLQRCLAPCRLEPQTPAVYVAAVERADALFAGASREVLELLTERMRVFARSGRYEEAAVARDRLAVLGAGCNRTQRNGALAEVPHLVAARRAPTGGWEVVCVRHGRLAGATRSPPGADPMPYIHACTATAEVVPPAPAPASAALPAETELLLRWLEETGVRLVELTGQWACPVNGAGPAALLAQSIARDTSGSTIGSTPAAGWWRSRVER
ncbi:MAG: DEDD exonuclease domain-containing protein, partial [Micrococcales bacterium]|nr:DEDD exonuclease domain-containing protein [Micrococcales bacterium]